MRLGLFFYLLTYRKHYKNKNNVCQSDALQLLYTSATQIIMGLFKLGQWFVNKLGMDCLRFFLYYLIYSETQDGIRAHLRGRIILSFSYFTIFSFRVTGLYQGIKCIPYSTLQIYYNLQLLMSFYIPMRILREKICKPN